MSAKQEIKVFRGTFVKVVKTPTKKNLKWIIKLKDVWEMSSRQYIAESIELEIPTIKKWQEGQKIVFDAMYATRAIVHSRCMEAKREIVFPRNYLRKRV